jgi:hypothetical protein
MVNKWLTLWPEQTDSPLQGVVARSERCNRQRRGLLARLGTVNPRAFLSLVGRLLPTTLTGPDDKDLFPEHAADPARLAQALLLAFQTLPRPEASGDREELPENR